MFENLSQSLQGVFRQLRGRGTLNDSNVKEALREVRMALLEADVHYQVAKDFVAKVREDCMGEEVLKSVKPGQQVVKHVHDRLVELLGGNRKDFNLQHYPAQIVLLGLHGSGKTTTAGKLAALWVKEQKKVMLAACDIRRPAAVDQLRILAEGCGALLTAPLVGESVPDVAERALVEARRQGADIIIYDTGGRFQIEEELVEELEELSRRVQPDNVVLVLDAAIGQESVEVAQTFHDRMGLTGLILTKLDGDARGGAALSVGSVTGCPVLRVGVGERPEDLEVFDPSRMAGRILGMGDVVGFVEQAQKALEGQDMAQLDKQLSSGTFTLEDFMQQMLQMRKLGPMDKIMDMLPGMPGMPKMPDNLDKAALARESEKEMKRSVAIIQSMTPEERRRPTLLNSRRRKRIALGSGTEVRDVNSLLKRFDQTRSMSKNMKKLQKRLLRGGR